MTAQATATATEEPVLVHHSNAYNIFILVLTIFSLTVMALLLLPVTPEEHELLHGLQQCLLHHLPHRLRDQRARRQAEAGVSRRQAWLARPAGIDPGLRAVPRRRAVAALPDQPAHSDHPPHARTGGQGPGPGRAPEPQPVRDLHHDPGGRDRALHGEHPCAPVRKPRRREHQDRRRCPLVGHRDPHDRRLWRLLPDHVGWAADGCVRDDHGRRHHRRAGQHPGEPPDPAAKGEDT